MKKPALKEPIQFTTEDPNPKPDFKRGVKTVTINVKGIAVETELHYLKDTETGECFTHTALDEINLDILQENYIKTLTKNK